MDRQIQHSVLTKLAAAYPSAAKAETLGFHQSAPDWVRNISYLAEHGLVRADLTQYLSGETLVAAATITAAGLDFLQADGGLTAILNVVTVRLDAGTIKALIANKIEQAPISAEEKSAWRTWLGNAGSEVLKEATSRLVAAALDHAPQALQLLQTLRG